MIKGITVILFDTITQGFNELGEPIKEVKPIEIENVLVAPSSTDDVTNTTNLTGRKAVYTLAIPKGDEHDWENKKVAFFGKEWRVVGIPQEGINGLIPLNWNKKVIVERYE
nr:MAG TPA: Minor capsid protein [Caudoviricetes sp.]